MAWFADKQEVVDCATRTIRQQRETIQEQDAKIKALESDLGQWKHAVGHLLSAVPVSEIVGVGGSITDLANWMKARHKDAATIKALVEALGKLCFEVAGLQAFEQGVRHEIGNTNYAAIMTRLEAGGVALAAAKDKPYE